MDTLEKYADCGCLCEVKVSFDFIDDVIEVEEILIIEACAFHGKDISDNLEE